MVLIVIKFLHTLLVRTTRIAIFSWSTFHTVVIGCKKSVGYLDTCKTLIRRVWNLKYTGARMQRQLKNESYAVKQVSGRAKLKADLKRL